MKWIEKYKMNYYASNAKIQLLISIAKRYIIVMTFIFPNSFPMKITTIDTNGKSISRYIWLHFIEIHSSKMLFDFSMQIP